MVMMDRPPVVFWAVCEADSRFFERAKQQGAGARVVWVTDSEGTRGR
jgi:hypothetical protein